MKTVIRNSYTPTTGDYCETIVVDKEAENAYIFDCDGVWTQLPQPVDVEKILEEAAAYTDEQIAPLAEKLDTIEEGAQVNVIEHVLRNGTELTVTDKTVNVTVPTKTSDLANDGSDGTDTYVESAALSDYYTKTETDTQIGYETTAREIADSDLQEQIDAIAASSDVVDIVGTYAALQAYDTSKLHDNDIIKVLTDETRDDATTYYRWDTDTSTWSYIGAEGPFYTKAESDATFVPQTRTVNGKALSADISLTASDVGALPDSTVIPTVNDATLTIQKNGTTVQTFTANQSSNATANIVVPTATSDLTNDGDGDSAFATQSYVDTYGGKIDKIEVNGVEQTITNKTVDIAVPTKTSDLTNDGSDNTSTYVEADELATVATTGDYDDLLNKPTIPTVNDATLTIQKNGTDVASFTANSASAVTANISVPTDTGDLTNGAGFITSSALSNYYTKSETYTQGEVNSLINTITVPTKTSDLLNDGADGTSTYVESSSLATVATTGDYDDLLNKPAIPSYSDFTGATSSVAGTHGLVPAPTTSDPDKYLKGDGTWATVAPELVEMSYGEANAWQKFINAYNDKCIVYCRASSNADPSSGAKTRKAFMAYVNNESTPTTVEFQYYRSVSSHSDSQQGDQVFVYTLTSSNGGTWSVTTRNAFTKIVAGTSMTSSYSNGTLTLNGKAVDSALSVSSTNPVQNSVVTAALNGKAPAPARFDWSNGQMYEHGEATTVTGSDVYDALEDGMAYIYDGETKAIVNYGTYSIWTDPVHGQLSDVLHFLAVDIDGGTDITSIHEYLYDETYGWLTPVTHPLQDKLTAGSNITISDGTISATVPDPTDYYWANVKVSSTSATDTAPQFNNIKLNRTNTYPHIGGDGSFLAFSADNSWGQGHGSIYLGKTSLTPSGNENGLISLGESGKSWKNLYLSGNIYKGSYTLTLPSKTGTVALTSDIPGDMTGATSSAAGTHGLVPAPAAGDQNKVLKGNGTWDTVGDTATMFYVNDITPTGGQYQQHIYTNKACTSTATGANIKTAFENGGARIAYVFMNITEAEFSVTSIVTPSGGGIIVICQETSESLLSYNYADLTDDDAALSRTNINDGTLTIKQDGTNVTTFSANQATAATANIQTKYVDRTADFTRATGISDKIKLYKFPNGLVVMQFNGVAKSGGYQSGAYRDIGTIPSDCYPMVDLQFPTRVFSNASGLPDSMNTKIRVNGTTGKVDIRVSANATDHSVYDAFVWVTAA